MGNDVTSPATPPPGWYPDPNGVMRWWDGYAWTETVANVPQPYTQLPYTPMPQGPLQLDAGAAASYGWKKFSQHAAFFVVTTLVFGVVSFGLLIASYIGLIVSTDPGASPTGATWILIGGAYIIAIGVSFVLQWALNHAALLASSGIAPSVRNVFSTQNLGRYIITSFLMGLIVIAGSILCLIPGLIAAVLFVFAPLIALDKGLGPVEALGRSYELVRSNLGQTLLTLLLSYGILYVGSMICYIGMAVTLPMSIVMIAYAYRVLDGQTVAP